MNEGIATGSRDRQKSHQFAATRQVITCNNVHFVLESISILKYCEESV
jgi:hypothetical protein